MFPWGGGGGGKLGGRMRGGVGKSLSIHVQCIYINMCVHNSSKDKKQFPWSEAGK